MILPLGAVVREVPLDEDEDEAEEAEAELLDDVEDDAELEALAPELVYELETSSPVELETELDAAPELDEDEVDP